MELSAPGDPDDVNDVDDLYLYDLETGEFELLSVSTDGAQQTSYHRGQIWRQVSDDARFGLVLSPAIELPLTDRPRLEPRHDFEREFDLFLRDRLMQTTTMVSIAADGSIPEHGPPFGAISGDGRTIVCTPTGPLRSPSPATSAGASTSDAFPERWACRPPRPSRCRVPNHPDLRVVG